MKISVLEATLRIQSVYRRQNYRNIFIRIIKLLYQLQQCDQNYFLAALNQSQIKHEPVKVIFKLRGAQFPPEVIYKLQLINSITLGTQNFQIPKYIQSQPQPFTNKNKHYMSLVKPRQLSSVIKLHAIKSSYEISLLFEISSKKLSRQKRETFRQRQARKLKKMFGIDEEKPIRDLDTDFFAASQASDLKEFIDMIQQSDKSINDKDKDKMIEDFFSTEYDGEKVDFDLIMQDLPGSQFV
ncbi:hypothetical protein SS50377_23356 [Spironucleus salmonicida]|uniref:Uncharacterized protein n=1 Tax=Spironucleus salmonicida TaxID=348837 RepID=V6LRF0_9EUKA|nr:hypothetical protein SS50377_23356 [Spironucleus salmonicida]|eukprot:EST47227.1 Hypothetical protein SS50377_12738 [Spironucleus salmonicida]